jgi:hypothetical protein
LARKALNSTDTIILSKEEVNMIGADDGKGLMRVKLHLIKLTLDGRNSFLQCSTL